METTDHWQDITDFYSELSAAWYVGCSGYKSARLIRQTEESFNSEGYDPNEDTIHITSPEIEIDLPDLDSVLKSISDSIDSPINNTLNDTTPDSDVHPFWQEWKSALVHEALHEYEHKVIKNNISNAGRALHSLYINNNFEYPELHAEAFYTAIADRAKYFILTPQALRERIQVRGSR